MEDLQQMESRAIAAGEEIRQYRQLLQDLHPHLWGMAPPSPNHTCGPESGCDQACADWASWCQFKARFDRTYFQAPTAFESAARELIEKAAKWDQAISVKVALESKLTEALKAKVGMNEYDFEIAAVLLGSLLEAAFQAPDVVNGLVCSAVLKDGGEILVEARHRTGEPYVKMAEGWRRKAEEWEEIATALENDDLNELPLPERVASAVRGIYTLIETADTLRTSLRESEALVERLEWLDMQRPSLAFGAEEKGQPESWGIYWTNKQKKVECAEATHLSDAIDKAREMMGFPTIDLLSGPLPTIREQQSADALEKYRAEVLAAQWQPWPPDDSETNECLAWRDDAGIFPVECRYEEGDGEPVWFSWGGVDDLTGDLPTLWHPMPKAPEKGGTR